MLGSWRARWGNDSLWKEGKKERERLKIDLTPWTEEIKESGGRGGVERG